MIYAAPTYHDFSYLSGVYLALNAIPDAYLLLDAPFCCYKKIEFIDKNHDLFCDILNEDRPHRIANTDINLRNSMCDRTSELKDMLMTLATYPGSGLVMLTSMPVATVTSIQYDMLIRKTQKRVQKKIIEIPSKAMNNTWLTAYEDTLIALAQNISKAPRQKKSIALIGYFMDRNEGDHKGNLKALEHVVKAFGHELTSVWLSRGTYEHLAKAASAEIIISLPYGRKAARVLAKRTKAELIELDLPFGIQGSIDWITTLGSALGKKQQAQKLIDRSMKEVMPVLKNIAPLFMTGRSASIFGDPHISPAIKNAIEEFGMNIHDMMLFGTEDRAHPEYLGAPLKESDIGIGNGYTLQIFPELIKKPYYQFGFPASGSHYLTEQPFMFFSGFVHFVNKIVNALQTPTGKLT